MNEASWIVFYVGVVQILLTLIVFFCTKSTLRAYLWGITAPLVVAMFFFLLPEGSFVAFFSAMGVLALAVVAFWLLNECSPGLHAKTMAEQKARLLRERGKSHE